jgi:SAM-dependent methyltransferase
MNTNEDIGFIGYTPGVQVSTSRPEEQEIYTQMWGKEEYRQIAPGEMCVASFLSNATPQKGSEIIDIGCGTGRAGLTLAILGEMKVTLLDFAENCLDANIQGLVTTGSQRMFFKDTNKTFPLAHPLKFVKADITKKLPVSAEYGFCTDVMEHIKPEDVDAALDNILLACKNVFFQIATVPDNHGKLLGLPLHLTVRPYEWWLERFKERECVIHSSYDKEYRCQFYVTAWQDGASITETGKVNETDTKIRENVKFNISQGWQQVVPHPENTTELMIVGGGWSLPEFEDEIRQKREEGVKLVTLNGAYKWCLDRNIIPSVLLMVDSRPHNFRFSKPVIDGCKYLIASQCHPSVFEGLPKDRTYIWHTSIDLIKDLLTEEYGDGVWYPVPGGSTALLRALPLFRMLGFKSFHLYGCDSCIKENPSAEYLRELEAFQKNKQSGEPIHTMNYIHHAYSQSENDSELVFPVLANPSGRLFYGHSWMISQAQEFMDVIKFLGDHINLQVHGDGLLAHILNTGAKLADEDFKIEQQEIIDNKLKG